MMKTASGVTIKPRTGRRRPPLSLWPAVYLGLCLAALLRPAVGLGAEVRPEIRYAYYNVPYTSGLSVSEMINLHTTLFNKRNRPLSGITDYLIRYELDQISPVPGVCSLKNPKVFCECEITLPKLVGGEDDPDLRIAFEAELAAINRHELTHCDIAVRYADMLLESFRNFKDMLCGDENEAARMEFERVWAECWEAQVQFDQREYGYKDHLDVGDFKREVGDNYQISDQTTDGSRPSLDRSKPSLAPGTPPPRRDPVAAAPPIRLDNDAMASPAPPPVKPTPSNVDAPAERGIYKDKDGVWRNY